GGFQTSGSGPVSAAMRQAAGGYDPQWIAGFNKFVEGGLAAVNLTLTAATLAAEAGSLGNGSRIRAALNTVDDATKGSTTLEKASGFYLLKFQSGKFYAGKGLESRMVQSINRIEITFGDKLVNKTFMPASSSREAFIREYKFMLQTGHKPLHWDPNSMLYNKIWSPGKKLLGQ
ncbi:MAG TPA: hypothetical protein GXX46_03820, partial [Peptococcaceae bacterium]|nr:hypothetical protein [Peptococcaceae bacterium]